MSTTPTKHHSVTLICGDQVRYARLTEDEAVEVWAYAKGLCLPLTVMWLSGDPATGCRTGRDLPRKQSGDAWLVASGLRKFLDIYAVGGTSFDVRMIEQYDTSKPVSQQDGKYLGRTEYGTIDSEGQYEGDDDEIIDHVRAEYGIEENIRAGVR